MWLSSKRYTELIDKAARAETRADWLMTRVNQLELELGHARAELTGRPQPVPTYRKDATPQPEDTLGAESFEDLGDDLARVHGVDS